MANKKTAKSTPGPKAVSQKEYLRVLIHYSKRAITNQGSNADEYFVKQTEKLEKLLREAK